MNVDEKEFFREATLRICGSLEIEKALWNCFMYAREFIPAQQAFLTYHDPNLGVVKVLAAATTGRPADRSAGPHPDRGQDPGCQG
jgi:hypothetical protein